MVDSDNHNDNDVPDSRLGHVLAHRDDGGLVTLAIFRCRKITIAAVNGHAVGNIAGFILRARSKH